MQCTLASKMMPMQLAFPIQSGKAFLCFTSPSRRRLWKYRIFSNLKTWDATPTESRTILLKILLHRHFLCRSQRHALEGQLAAMLVRSMSGNRQGHPENCTQLGCIFNHNVAAVVLNNLLHHGQAKSGAVLFSGADEGLE